MSSAPPPPKRSPGWSLIAIAGVPAIAGAVTTGVLVGPGRQRPVDAARVYGRPTRDAPQLALQVQVVRFDGDLVTPAPALDLTVALAGATSGRWSGPLAPGDDEAAEAVVTLSSGWTKDAAILSIMRADGGVLAEAVIHPEPAPPPPSGVAPPPDGLSITLPRGGAVPELPEPMVVILVAPPHEAAPKLTVEVQGGTITEVPKPTRDCDDARCRWTWDFEVISRATSTGVTAHATLEGDRFTHEQWLELRPGALWLSPDGREVRAASPREHAFVALHDARGRAWATRLTMTVDERGFASAPLSLPPLPSPAAVSLASEPGVAADRRWVWPVASRPLAAAPPMRLLADGLPAARTREAARQARARRPAFALVVVAAFFELAFLYWQRQSSQAQLTRRMREAEIDPEQVTARPAAWWLVVLSGALLLAFLALATLALFGAQLPV